jgi:hypothetical protein
MMELTRDAWRFMALILGGGLGVVGSFLLIWILRLFDLGDEDGDDGHRGV